MTPRCIVDAKVSPNVKKGVSISSNYLSISLIMEEISNNLDKIDHFWGIFSDSSQKEKKK